MFKNYILVTLRNIRRYKAYSVINIAGLAIGMACFILIMLYIQDEFKFDRYPDDVDQLYRLVLDAVTPDGDNINTARTPPPWAPALANDYPEVENYVRFKTPLVSWLLGNEEQDKRFHEKGFYFTDPTVFEFFNFEMIQGNPNTALIDPQTLVITESMANKYFGTENPMNKVLRLDNTYDFRVTGIMKDVPRNSHITFDFLASFSTLSAQAIYGGTNYATFQATGLFPDVYTYLRLTKDFSASDFEKKFPEFLDRYVGNQIRRLNIEMRPYLQPLSKIHLHSNLDAELQANSNISYIYIFSAIALFIILLACINFMNLATARSANRAQEVGMRKVLGAYRGQLIKQFLGETIVLAFISLIIALVMVNVMLPFFNLLSGKQLRLVLTDFGLMAGFMAIVVFVGIVSGSYPAFFLSNFQPVVVLRGSSKTATGHSWLRRILVVGQFAISIIFIISTGIVYKQMNFIQHKNLGFEKERVVVIPLGDPRARQIYMSFKNLALQNPDVLALTACNNMPGGLMGMLFFQPEGVQPGENISIEHLIVDHDFIKAFGIELVSGRDFSLSFPTDTFSAFILNETAIEQLGWKDTPLNRQIHIGNFKQGRVIGVVKDFHVKSLHQRIEPLMIHIATNKDQLHYLAIKMSGANLVQTLDFLKECWRQVYPHDPFIYSFLDDDFDSLYRTEELRGNILASFSLLAIIIACLGLLGLASFTSEQRTKEIGIRKVLGASESSIVFMLLREFAQWVIIANIFAWPVAYYAMSRWLNNFAYKTHLSLFIFFASGALALIVALLTVGTQALKAAMANPVEAIKYE